MLYGSRDWKVLHELFIDTANSYIEGALRGDLHGTNAIERRLTR